MPTAQQMINRAYRLSGELASGETLASEDSSDALIDLNAMLDSMRIQKRYVYTIAQRSLSWGSGNASRTIGSGGDFNTTRPDFIESAFVTVGSDYPVQVLREREQYDAIPQKTTQGDIPAYLFYDHAYSSSLGTLYLYPVPSSSVTLKLNVGEVLQTFVSLGTDLALPPGYQEMIETTLAENVCASVGLPVPPQLAKMAFRARRAIKISNLRQQALTNEVAYMNRPTQIDITTGEQL